MGNFWSYVASFQNIQPVTTVLVLLQIGVFVYQTWRKVQPEEFAFRYDAVVEGKEYWRCVTATFSHLGIFHVSAQHTYDAQHSGMRRRLRSTSTHSTAPSPQPD